jgi:hypothetical protein
MLCDVVDVDVVVDVRCCYLMLIECCCVEQDPRSFLRTEFEADADEVHLSHYYLEIAIHFGFYCFFRILCIPPDLLHCIFTE